MRSTSAIPSCGAILAIYALSACADPQTLPQTQDMAKDMAAATDMRPDQRPDQRTDLGPDQRADLDMSLADLAVVDQRQSQDQDQSQDMNASDMADASLSDMADAGLADADMGPRLANTCLAGAIPITIPTDDSVLTLTGDTTQATADIAYPSLDSSCQSVVASTQHQDIAYTFTAPADGQVFAEVQEAARPTQHLLVYALEGPCAAQAGLACSGIARDQITFPVRAGQTYTVVVDHDRAMQASAYTLRLGYTTPRPNDTCAAASQLVVPVDGTPVLTRGNTLQATSTRSPQHGLCLSATDPNPAPRDLFYAFEAPATGTIEVALRRQSEWSSALYALESCAAGSPELACRPLSDGTIDVPVIQGQTYYIAVDGFGTRDAGEFELQARFLPPDTLVQPGERCDDASPLPMPAFGGSTSFDMFLGTPQPNMTSSPLLNDYTQPCEAPPSFPAGTTSGGDGVYRFTAPQSGLVRLRTEGSDIVLYAYDQLACAGAALTCSGSAQQGGRFVTSITLNVTQGQTYYVVFDLWASFSTISRNTVTVEYGATLP